MSGKVYGRCYELITGDPQDGEHPYVGQTTDTIYQRVYGKQDSAHTSAKSIAKDPWKARILPNPAGYRCLKVIYATGDPVADQMRLDLAESILIDELRPTHNKVRPIRPAKTAAPRRVAAKSVARRKRSAKPALLILLVALFTIMTARVMAAGHAHGAAPWVVAPVLGVVLGWLTLWRLHRMWRKLTR